MSRGDMLFYIAVVYASVVTVTAFLLEAKLTAVFTEQGSCSFTVFTDYATVEAVAAVLAEMELIIIVLYADGWRFGAIGIALTAVKAKAAGVADVHLAKGVSAVGAEMVVPIGVFYAVFPAGAALSLGVILTAENTKSAGVATEAVPAVIYVALLASHTVEAKDGLAEAGSAFVTVGGHKAVRAGTVDTAGAAHSAAVFVPVIVVTVPAVHTVLVVGKDADDRGGNYAYEHHKRKKDSYYLFQNSVFHTSAPLSDGLTQAVRCGITY